MRRIDESLAVVWPVHEERSIDAVGTHNRLVLSIIWHLICMVSAHRKGPVNRLHEVHGVSLSILSVMKPHVPRPRVPPDVHSVLVVPPDHEHSGTIVLVVCPEGMPFHPELVLLTRVLGSRVCIHNHRVAPCDELPAGKDNRLVRSSHPLEHLGGAPVVRKFLQVLPRKDHDTLERRLVVATGMRFWISHNICLESLAIEQYLGSEQCSFQRNSIIVLGHGVEDTNHLVDSASCIDRLQTTLERNLKTLEDTFIARAGQRAGACLHVPEPDKARVCELKPLVSRMGLEGHSDVFQGFLILLRLGEGGPQPWNDRLLMLGKALPELRLQRRIWEHGGLRGKLRDCLVVEWSVHAEPDV
mmetsp:Transcript_28630/g.64875  ORF Transcript_28630/g.64875 Transcript_28630/m.64875 type:complete len:357 (+) Transcript_28630:682-1752(+)